MVLKILLGVLTTLFAGSQAEGRGFAAERRSASAMRAKPARNRRLALHDVLQELAIRDTRTRDHAERFAPSFWREPRHIEGGI